MSTHEAAMTGKKPQAWLWYGVLIGPAAWKLQLMVNYALVPYACWHRLEILNHLASLLLFLLALSGALMSWRSWQRSGQNLELSTAGVAGRSRFMAGVGLILSAYCALLIVGQWAPNLVLSACDGIS